jgi:hypothetical protein
MRASAEALGEGEENEAMNAGQIRGFRAPRGSRHGNF